MHWSTAKLGVHTCVYGIDHLHGIYSNGAHGQGMHGHTLQVKCKVKYTKGTRKIFKKED